jgi:hypothetical protein
MRDCGPTAIAFLYGTLAAIAVVCPVEMDLKPRQPFAYVYHVMMEADNSL